MRVGLVADQHRRRLDGAEDADDLPEPEELATEAISELVAATGELKKIIELLENGKPSEKMGRKATGRNPDNFGSAAGLLSDISTSAEFASRSKNFYQEVLI